MRFSIKILMMVLTFLLANSINANEGQTGILINDDFDTDTGQWQAERSVLDRAIDSQDDYYLSVTNRISKSSGIYHDIKDLINPGEYYQFIAQVFVPESANNEKLEAKIVYKADGLYIYKFITIGTTQLTPGQWTTVNYIFQMPNHSQIDKGTLKLTGLNANVDFFVNDLVLKKFNYVAPQPPADEHLLINDTGDVPSWIGAATEDDGSGNSYYMARFGQYYEGKYIRSIVRDIPDGLLGNTEYVLSAKLRHAGGTGTSDIEKAQIILQYKQQGIYIYRYLTITNQELTLGQDGSYVWKFNTPDVDFILTKLIVKTISGSFELALDDIMLWVAESDSDGDGIVDSKDLCPDTPIIEIVDNDGCSSSQNLVDTDGDGVPDNEDAFPNDADESIDTDEDGVGNNADLDDDNDGYSDSVELEFLSNPLDPLDIPNIVLSELYTYEGTEAESRFGSDVANAGDLNGDGYSEFIVSNYKEDDYRGRVQVYSGIDGTLMYDILGDNQYDYFGFNVSTAGDVNADGFDDFIVSTYRYSDNDRYFGQQEETGQARVYSGINGQLLYTFYGDSPSHERDKFGYSASGAGDVNNDGYDDIIVGAPDDINGTSYHSGSAKVFSGKDGAILYKFTADESGDQFGRYVTAAGDINQDGFDDVAVGIPRADVSGYLGGYNLGLVRLYSGADGSVIYNVQGDADNDEFGHRIAFIGDVNGDGYPDFSASSTKNDDGGISAGKVKVFSGIDGSTLYNIIGAAKSDYLGSSISPINDFNFDNINDLAIGSYGNDQSASNAGLIDIVSGVDGTPLFSLTGLNENDYFGYSLDGLSDINGDGFGDLIVSAWGHDGNGNDTGKVSVFVSDSDPDHDGVGTLHDAYPLDPTQQ